MPINTPNNRRKDEYARRKPVECVLCHEAETRSADSVCAACFAEWKEGHALLERVEAGTHEAEVYWVSLYLHVYGHHNAKLRGTSSDIQSQLYTALLGLAEAHRTEMHPGEIDEAHRILAKKDEWHSNNAARLIKPGKASLLRKIIDAIQSLCDYSYTDGYERGSDLIGRLAADELTVTELSAAERKGK